MKLVTMTNYLSRRYGDKKAIEIIKSAGFDGYDYTMPIHQDGMEEFIAPEYWDKIKELKAHADAIGFPCLQAHAPYDDSQTDLLPAVIRGIEYAAYLGAEVIVVHANTDNYNYYEHIEDLFKENMEYYRTLIPYAEKLNIKIAIENLFGWLPDIQHNIENVCSHHDELAKYVDTLNSEYIVACVDTGHCNLVHEAPETMIKNLGSRVGALHVHDNTGLDDAHNIPYSGTINWDNVCHALAEVNYKGNFTFEADRFFKNSMDDEHIINAAKYLEQVGRSLIRKIK